MADPALSIVVLQWNRHDLTSTCVTSIRHHTPVDHELIIVDNGSESEAASFASEAADIPVLLDENVGFAAGMNHGLQVASGGVIAFVNNDTTVPVGWAERLMAIAERDGVGVVAPAVTSGGNRSSVRSTPGDRERIASPFIDLPSGVVYVMETAFIRRLGGWSEHYPVASSEDLDLLFATWVTDHDVIIDDTVLVDHVGSATADTLPGKGKRWRENRRTLVERWSDMDEQRFRQIYAWQGPVSEARLENARIAAYWMARFFAADDAVKAPEARPPKEPDPAPQRSQRNRWFGRGSD